MNVVNKLISTVQYTPPDLKMGLGDPTVEFSCSEVHVFARVVGGRVWSYRTIVPPKTQLGQLKQVFEQIHGGPIVQTCLVDENGYTFSQLALEQPVSKFSNKCRLHVDFARPDGVVGAAKSAYENALAPKL
jgi:hypothetical protein